MLEVKPNAIVAFIEPFPFLTRHLPVHCLFLLWPFCRWALPVPVAATPYRKMVIFNASIDCTIIITILICCILAIVFIAYTFRHVNASHTLYCHSKGVT